MNDNDRELDLIGRRLRSAMPPLGEQELRVDLWPRMLRRLEDPPPAFGWFEYVLAGAVALTFAIFPTLLPALLYHL